MWIPEHNELCKSLSLKYSSDVVLLEKRYKTFTGAVPFQKVLMCTYNIVVNKVQAFVPFCPSDSFAPLLNVKSLYTAC